MMHKILRNIGGLKEDYQRENLGPIASSSKGCAGTLLTIGSTRDNRLVPPRWIPNWLPMDINGPIWSS